MPEKVVELNMRTLLHADRYLIPYYQRDYAWAQPQVEQLLRDIQDSWERPVKEGENHAYYLGTLVVNAEITKSGEHKFETIDGQQRLTTLHIIWGALKALLPQDVFRDYRLNLEFACRDRATASLKAIDEGEIESRDGAERHSGIQDAHRDVVAFFKNRKKFRQNDVVAFAQYFLDHVKIIRVQVPQHTDLNHYFETMNSRGEQLEKHEILKAQLMAHLDHEKGEQSTFANIWEACADMSRYVQMGFSTDHRAAIWGNNWDWIQYTSFDEINAAMIRAKKNADDELKGSAKNLSGSVAMNQTLAEMVRKLIPESQESNNRGEDSPDRFQPAIDFPNFLLQVLRLHWHHGKADYGQPDSGDVALDDKQLIKEFERTILNPDNPDPSMRVKRFAYDLLWLRWKLDSYILKRDHSEKRAKWSLLKLRNATDPKENKVRFTKPWSKDDGEEIDVDLRQMIMVQSMFHVTYSGNAYKNWLTGALNFIYRSGYATKLDQGNYLRHLEDMARAYLFEHYLKPDEKGHSAFHKIVFPKSETVSLSSKEPDWEILNSGVGTPHFVFNYLDYLLWKRDKKGPSQFEFTSSRNSIEHFYPQVPKEGILIEQDATIHHENVHRFGNLCLLNRSKNSEISNYLPPAKIAHFKEPEKESLKFQLMRDKAGTWSKSSIDQHGKEMIDVLKETFNS
jgi:Protein of unknown function DUF262/Protein of unknown function (DUF1524)